MQIFVVSCLVFFVAVDGRFWCVFAPILTLLGGEVVLAEKPQRKAVGHCGMKGRPTWASL